MDWSGKIYRLGNPEKASNSSKLLFMFREQQMYPYFSVFSYSIFLCCYFCFELLLPLLRCCCYYYCWCFEKKINSLWCWFFVAVVTAARIWYQCWNQCLIHSLMAYNECYIRTLQTMFWLTSRSTIPTQHSNSMKFYFWISINFVRLLKFIISIIF